MRIYLSDHFSLSMLDRDEQDGISPGTARVPRPVRDAPRLIRGFHKAGVEILSACRENSRRFEELLGIPAPPSNRTVKLSEPDHYIVVGQAVDEDGEVVRLTDDDDLPFGVFFEWWMV